MMMATQLSMSTSSFLCPCHIVSNQAELRICSPATLVVCQQDSLERKTAATARVSRRFLTVASASAIAVAMGVFTCPRASEAKRNKPPPPQEKESLEDKSLGKNEQRALANARRKEAMKTAVETAKAKANSISSPQ